MSNKHILSGEQVANGPDQHKRPEIEFSANSIPYTKSAIPEDQKKSSKKVSPRY